VSYQLTYQQPLTAAEGAKYILDKVIIEHCSYMLMHAMCQPVCLTISVTGRRCYAKNQNCLKYIQIYFYNTDACQV